MGFVACWVKRTVFGGHRILLFIRGWCWHLQNCISFSFKSKKQINTWALSNLSTLQLAWKKPSISILQCSLIEQLLVLCTSQLSSFIQQNKSWHLSFWFIYVERAGIFNHVIHFQRSGCINLAFGLVEVVVGFLTETYGCSMKNYACSQD
jgi:hypothetical protein